MARGTADTPLNAITQQLDMLSQAELLEVQAMVSALLAWKVEAVAMEEEASAKPEEHRGPKGGEVILRSSSFPTQNGAKPMGLTIICAFGMKKSLKLAI